ncbi:CAP domain-containing protein [Streptomyces sp. SID14478]|uniref:CAP domain-containing protein n=1 Tax=Streptomyces sp. SID14478 TaxID=2706073 RepID=UPI0013DEC53E|nr:CAP domain-containing protein [Streptomyces sp. SID14478]NEB81420.1 CAP domain-containing protein [Streptomyces sp. SID14478]
MGRHRRSAAGRAATGRAAGTPETHPEDMYAEPYGEAYGAGQAGSYPGAHTYEHAYGHEPEQTYGYGAGQAHGYAPEHEYASSYAHEETAAATYGSISPAGGSGQESRGHAHRRKKRGGVPVRTGLLGVSAAVALGAVAVASGLIPGGDDFKLGGDHGGNKVQAAGSPTVEAQGGTDGSVDDRAPSSASRGTERSTPSASPSKSASPSAPAKPSKKPSPSRTSSGGGSTQTKSASPSTQAPEKTQAPAAQAPATSSQSAAAAQVLSLVNQERAKAGCSPVTADGGLASLATAFSEDMAARNFFDHTDPDGATPWDRAKKVGITDLGGENIARGQANAQSVMDAWMNSPGHRANILNCDYKTLGVGVHFGSGGPWWTQDFGF